MPRNVLAAQDPPASNSLFTTSRRNALLDAARGGLMGLTTDVLGTPVDLATAVMRPFGYSVPDRNVIGSSDWLASKLGVSSTDSSAELAGRTITGMLSPSPSDAAKLVGLLASAPIMAKIRKGVDTGEMIFPDARVVASWKKKGDGPDALADDLDSVIRDIQSKIASGKGRYGIRVDEAARGLVPGQKIPRSKKWVDGVQTEKDLSGTSVINIRDGSPEAILEALSLAGVGKRDPVIRGYYPGSQVSLVKNGD